MRRGVHEALYGRACDAYQPGLEQNAVILVSQVLKDPDHWELLYRRFMHSRTLETIYGWQTTDQELDVIAKQSRMFMKRVSWAAMPGTFLVDFLPCMRYVPSWMAKWKREGLQWFYEAESMLDALFTRNEANLVQLHGFLLRHVILTTSYRVQYRLFQKSSL